MAENNEYILKHPHDSFFKKSFSKPEIAKDFLKNYLPEKVLKHIDLNTLSNQNGEYIDEKLKKDFSDLLYQVEIAGNVGYIYLLFEHKSYEDEKVIFQLLRYMTRIWGERFDNEKKKVPIIIPLVIYHGKNVWKIATRFWNYFDRIEKLPKALQQMVPDFTFNLYDYSPKSKTEIKGRAILQAVLKMLKASLERSDSVQTLAQRLLNEGIELEKEKALINFYKKGFPLEHIAEGLELSKEKAIQIIEKAKKEKKIEN